MDLQRFYAGACFDAYRYLGGLPYAEIAAILGGSVAAARRAGADGIANLRTILKEHS